MLLHFRQGIVEAQIPVFFRVTYPSVDLIVTDTNTTVAFAAGSKDYLYTEQQSVANAWGPLHLGIDQWLYWDLDNRTGYRTFGITIVEPIVASSMPSSPVMDQHWFDTTACEMKVWTGNVWSKKIRTFACKLAQGRVPVSMSANSPSFIGTQVGNTSDTYAGHIIYDATTNNAIKNANGQFITTEDKLSTKTISLSHVKVASIIIEGEAQQNMAAHTIVVFSEFGKIVHANQFTADRPVQFGIIESAAVVGQTVNVITHGMVSSPNWDWTSAGVNALLYCSADGELTTTPVVPKQNPVAIVIDPHTIQLGAAVASTSASESADVGLATQMEFGIVRLSHPAEDPEDPIAVGDNDPRLTNARPPAYHTHPIEQVILLPEALDDKVDVAGDTMTGFLSLNEDPIEPLHAVTKQYVDNRTVWAAGRQYQVQYNMAGKFAASDALTLYPGTENAPTVALLDLGSYNFELAVLHSPKTLQVEAGGTQDGLSYPLILQGGGSLASGAVVGDQSIRAGDVIVRGGLASSNVENASFGGDACIYGGNGYTTNGDVNIRGGEEQEDGTFNSFANGGHVYISGGSVGNTKVAGDVNISGGSARPGGAGVAGNVRIHTNGYERLRINNTGEWVLNGSGVGTPGQVLVSQGADQPPTWGYATGGGSSLDGVTGYPITALGIGAGTNVRSYAPSNSPWVGESTAIGTNAMNAVTSASSGNVALGTDTLRYSSRAQYNTAVGTRSLATINDAIIGTVSYASPSHNTALGFRTLEAVQCVQWRDHGTELPFNMIASKNVCVGSNAGSELLRSAGGVAIGYSAMRSGSVMFNVAIGSEAMRYCTNITTDTNTSQTREVVERAGDVAIGPNAMRGAAPAYDYTLSLPGTRSSVAIGMNSMANKAAQSSVAVGYATLSQTTSTAVNSVAVGVSALQVCGAGVNNTAVGYKSLQMLTSGSNNVAIGNLAGQDAVANLTTQSNYVVLGNNSTTNANIKVAWTVTSDARDKTEIAPIPVGLEFINQLSPKQFKLMDRETQQPTTGIRYGFIAQDVLSAEGDDPVIVDVTDINNLKLRESLIVPALVKAVQELSAEIALLKLQLHNLTH